MAAAESPGPSLVSAGNAFFTSGSSNTSSGTSVLSTNATQFREIHKNSWLKRLTTEGRKITVGHRKSERSWVVFCVHDDCEPLLEGYAEPRHAASHAPEWVMSIQDTLHISHALIPNSHEFEFVITLSNDVLRFHASSWEIMQEWVETLRSKLREMKILSPRENLYTKLPEIRVPLLPTRDPTSPLPAPPPVPAAFVPGVERVVVQSGSRLPNTNSHAVQETPVDSTSEQSINSVEAPDTNISTFIATSTSDIITTNVSQSSVQEPQESNGLMAIAMSNTLPQNLLNMLSDPLTTYSEHLNEEFNANDDNEDKGYCETANEEKLPCLPFDLILCEEGVTEIRDSEIKIKTEENQENSTSIECHIPSPKKSHSIALETDDTRNKHEAKLAYNKDEHIKNVNAHEDGFNYLETSTSDPTDNITIIEVPSCDSKEKEAEQPLDIEIHFPQLHTPLVSTKTCCPDHTSNIQISPSNNVNSTIIVQPGQTNSTHLAVNNQYSPSLKNISSKSILSCSPPLSKAEMGQQSSTVTKVRVGSDTMASSSDTVLYSKCFLSTSTPNTTQSVSKKIILSTNSSGVTNIEVNNVSDFGFYQENSKSNRCTITPSDSSPNQSLNNRYCEKVFLSPSNSISSTSSCANPIKISAKSSELLAIRKSTSKDVTNTAQNVPDTSNLDECFFSSDEIVSPVKSPQLSKTLKSVAESSARTKTPSEPVTPHKHTSSINILNTSTVQPESALRTRPRVLVRGLTEAVISTRSSRKDNHLMKSIPSKTKSHSCQTNNNKTFISSNEDGAIGGSSSIMDPRRRSSSTSDVQILRSVPNTYNNGICSGHVNSNTETPLIRQAFRSAENGITGHALCPPNPNSSPTKRLTLREQQVIQLRREIMHPGGVRLQLRRKDCVGSIAWVDVFGAVWVAGWKQKEHPVLYNALHIGDQLITVAGIPVNSATDANKIIRNTNTLFIEVVVRRIPFGRGYAIRRDREGQCLGLIRDENSSTIVDVIPNSLAARHGLPPKAQSCDGTTLTFWVLTEINGRPLNLFFKDTEIRDRLNSVGRDISILVQPSDLITKLKKQLKSLRGYKDYLLQ